MDRRIGFVAVSQILEVLPGLPRYPHRGEPEALGNHYLLTPGKTAPIIFSFFAYAPLSRVLCYSNADLTRGGQAEELMRFVEFTHDLIDRAPQWLYFDSKVVPHSKLAKLMRRKIEFVTICRRGAAILRAAALNRDYPPVPWLGVLQVAFEYP
jgi:hypothetical protein